MRSPSLVFFACVSVFWWRSAYTACLGGLGRRCDAVLFSCVVVLSALFVVVSLFLLADFVLEPASAAQGLRQNCARVGAQFCLNPLDGNAAFHLLVTLHVCAYALLASLALDA